ncbi:hypothetical protein BKI52_18640 [marine bacterium AO1-C]|nr:hypothetical protein BKI52_18640 [marine bacterium AO1-C]
MNQSLIKELDNIRSLPEQYHKNVLYVSPKQQNNIREKTILFAGVGLGSVIAEAVLRIGFEKFILIDGDQVEKSNLNRQNYISDNVGVSKVNAVKQRLLSINPKAQIETHQLFLTPENMDGFIKRCDIAINAIDFDIASNSLLFDKICQKNKVPIVHPFNFGWAGAAYVITPESDLMPIKSKKNTRYELTLIKDFIKKYKKKKGLKLDWFEKFLEDYSKYSSIISPPQLVVGSHLASAIVTNILFSLSNGIKVKTFPKSYFLSSR